MSCYAILPYDEIELTSRMWSKVEKPDGEHGCWIFEATNLGGGGYAGIRIQGHIFRAHRLFYTALVGPVPTGLVIDHLCRVKRCVNPAHLEPVTQAENARRGDAGLHHRIKTHCRNGHPYSGANLYSGPHGRSCRACNNAASARYRDRKVAA